ncbi:TNF receptor-associated factor homolog 1b-like [Nymphaea colorata]|nr:TNF receptor-associated factor homolog 1b-like [Nymphaea colorata]
MAGSVSDDNGMGGSSEVISSNQRCPSGDSISEWRSCEQVENGTPSTSPPYWDTDDDDDCGPKPSELYGKFTWKIENFSQINKRELRSNAFEVGGYKWYILVYPQGCDVCNHLSLFLCVANHDKLLPGWSHFAQFTIAVVNKDPKKSKYSDTLHRFWKKEHDWGWKKFMELSKVFDGFIVGDMLVIKAQVQVIREKAHRPFRCLDCQYRRELVRVYLTNVEGICRRFVEERRSKLGKLIEDKGRWTSFRAFWLGMDQNARRRMSREKSDTILKLVVKQFFIEKEVTSTLVMDSLYSGLKALESQSSNTCRRTKSTEHEEMPLPIVHVEKDMFVLADDVLQLLERAAAEPLPPLKDDKGPQNRTKEGMSGEDLNKDSIERDERRLTELGRRTVEIFAVTQIYCNRIEVAYQEAVALKRQEELIREEEAAWQAENDLKSKRAASDKEKRTKKKQAKQKRNNRKKDKAKDEKSGALLHDKHQKQTILEERTLVEFSAKEQSDLAKCDAQECDVSDVSDTVEYNVEACQPTEDRDVSPVNWDTDMSEIHPATEASGSEISIQRAEYGKIDKKNRTAMDDSSSTCSTDSVPSIVMNGQHRGHALRGYNSQTSPSREKNEQAKECHDQIGSTHDGDRPSLDSVPDAGLVCDDSSTCGSIGPESDSFLSLKDRTRWVDQHIEKDEVSLQQKRTVKNVDLERPSKQSPERAEEVSSSPASPPTVRNMKPTSETSETSGLAQAEPVLSRQASTNSPSEKGVLLLTRSSNPFSSTSQNETQRPTSIPKVQIDHHDNSSLKTISSDANAALSRPSSAPIFAASRATTSVISTTSSPPLLARSVSAAGRLGTSIDQQSATSCSPAGASQSYRNAIMNGHKVRASGIPSYSSSSYPRVSPASSYSQPLSSTSATSSLSHGASSPASITTSMLCQSSSVRKPGNSAGTSNCPGFTFGTVAPEILQPPHQSELLLDESSPVSWLNDSTSQEGENSLFCESYFQDVPSLEVSSSGNRRPMGLADSQDEFPHLDIINYLFDEEHSIGKAATVGGMLKGPGNHIFNRQFTFPGLHGFGRGSDMGMMDPGTSLHGSQLERSARYAGNSLQLDYGSRTGWYDIQREGHDIMLSSYMAQPTALAESFLCTNPLGQLHWSADSSDISLLRNSEADGSLFQMPVAGYTNLGCSNGLNGYSVFRPANGR